MEKQNKERVLISIIKQLQKEIGFEAYFLCYDWLIKLCLNNKVKHILGYDWELNSSTSQLIAKDKSACHELLLNNNIPTLEYKLFLSPQFQSYIGKNGSWENLISYFDSIEGDVVCKPNTGTGGNEVFRIKSKLDLEAAVHSLFSKYRGIVLSPFYNIKVEYRAIVLDYNIKLIYAKSKPVVIGDGEKSLLELITSFLKEKDTEVDKLNLENLKMEQIPMKNESISLGWQHNLGKGATATTITLGEKHKELSEIAIKAASSLNIRFASVDIVEANGKYYVMEVNSGVMMENFAKASKENYDSTEKIYKEALVKMLKIT